MQKWHHANIVVGVDDCKEVLFEIFDKDLNFQIHKNPDFTLVENESFGISDARDFEKWIIGKPLLGNTKVSLIITKSITAEAQNAMLKLLEEPPFGTYVFINLESLGNLLGTFLSRVRVVDLSQLKEGSQKYSVVEKIKSEGKTELNKFVKGSVGERLVTARSMSLKEDKNDIKDFIKNLEEVSYLSKNIEHRSLKHILLAKMFLSARGSSPKMILEWLSCVL
jgi:DNA polymerase-3 subunit delta'